MFMSDGSRANRHLLIYKDLGWLIKMIGKNQIPSREEKINDCNSLEKAICLRG
jgi:hypothetical protein